MTAHKKVQATKKSKKVSRKSKDTPITESEENTEAADAAAAAVPETDGQEDPPAPQTDINNSTEAQEPQLEDEETSRMDTSS